MVVPWVRDFCGQCTFLARLPLLTVLLEEYGPVWLLRIFAGQ